MADKETTQKKITPKKVFLCILAAALIVLAAIFAPPFIKDRVFEHKVKQSLFNAYPGAKITRVKYLKPYTQDGFWHDHLYHWKEYSWESNGKTFKTERFEPQNKKIREKWS